MDEEVVEVIKAVPKRVSWIFELADGSEDGITIEGGFKPLVRLSIPNSIELMHLWMLKDSLRLLPLLLFCFLIL